MRTKILHLTNLRNRRAVVFAGSLLAGFLSVHPAATAEPDRLAVSAALGPIADPAEIDPHLRHGVAAVISGDQPRGMPASSAALLPEEEDSPVVLAEECCELAGNNESFPRRFVWLGNVISIVEPVEVKAIRVDLRIPAGQTVPVTFGLYRLETGSTSNYLPIPGGFVESQPGFAGTGATVTYTSPSFGGVLLEPDQVDNVSVRTRFAIGVGWDYPNDVLYSRFGGAPGLYPEPFCLPDAFVEGFWFRSEFPPDPLDPDPITIASPFTGAALTSDICFTPEPGACCTTNGCVLAADEDECTAEGGEFTAPGVTCEEVFCPLPRGACCRPDCRFLTEFECIAENGAWEEGRNCQPFDPCADPVGACCLIDGGCLDDQTQADCDAVNGNFSELMTCAEVESGAGCDVVGACCFALSCELLTAAECNLQEGAYQGDGVQCLDPPTFPVDSCDETIGACCLFDGECLPGVTEYDCTYNNGTDTPGRWEELTACVSAQCTGEKLGACCVDGVCVGDVIEDVCMPTNGTRIWHEGRPCRAGPCRDDGTVGACCLLDDCVVSNSIDCAEVIGGFFTPEEGLGTSGFEACALTDCTSVTAQLGACCNFDEQSNCALLTQTDCDATSNGTFLAEGVACSQIGCAVSRCDFTDGTCEDLSRADCITAGGTPGTPGTRCTVQFGACCFDDGSCLLLTESDCNTQGGAYNDGLTCQEADCPIRGACCANAGTPSRLCLGVQDDTDCVGGSLTFAGAGTDCTLGNASCDVAACCQPDGACSLELRAVCLQVLGGTFLEDVTTCGVGTCEVAGSCCLLDSNGVSCTVLTESECDAAGGVFSADAEPCGADACPVRACCQPDDMCVDTLPEVCLASGGLPAAGDERCADGDFCGVGACCFQPGGSGGLVFCVDDSLNGPACAQQAGFIGFGGSGSACGANGEAPCQVGACCEPDGSCAERIRTGCELLDGAIFQGADSTCDVNTCSLRGACCLDTGTGGFSCAELSESECTDAGGSFNAAASCDAAICVERACCVAGAPCRELLPIDCANSSGLLAEVGEDCAAIDDCGSGACCVDSNGTNTCLEVDNALACRATAGFVAFRGADSDCSLGDATCTCAPADGIPIGDWDGFSDGAPDVDLKDFAALQRCWPNPTEECLCVFDANGNQDLDAEDWAVFADLLGDLGACCLSGGGGDATCVRLTALNCERAGGTRYRGATTTCAVGACACDEFDGGSTTIGDGDYNADGEVDLLDYAALQDCLTSGFVGEETYRCRCAFDFNGDEVIDDDDLFAFFSLLTGEPGACCVPDGLGGYGCQQLTDVNCAATNGFFAGEAVACTPDTCSNGACCTFSALPELTCEELPGPVCAAQSGFERFRGSGTSCVAGACDCSEVGNGNVTLCDYNGDGSATLEDQQQFQLCVQDDPVFLGEATYQCLCAFDFDGDNDLDIADQAAANMCGFAP